MFKRFSVVNASKYFYVNRLCDILNSLSEIVVEAPSIYCVKRLLDSVDFSSFCMTRLIAAAVVKVFLVVKFLLRAWINGFCMSGQSF